MTKAFAIDALRHWYEMNSDKLSDFETRIELPEDVGHGASIEIDSPPIHIVICAWDQGNSLEIAVAGPDKTTINEAACVDGAELNERLDAFLHSFLGSNC